MKKVKFWQTSCAGALPPPLPLALGAYVVFGLLLLPQYWSFYYKDEIAIVAPAENWARGHFAAAINAYWGPLASWLIAPFVWLGAPAILATRLVSLAVGAGTLVAAKRLATAFELPNGLQLAFLLLLVPYLVYFSVRFFLGDLPMICVLILYFAVIFDPLYGKRRFAGALCGLLGGLAYLAKVYALPFFLIHFTLCSIILYLARPDREERRRVLRHLAAGLGIFAILASGWIAVLHQKYGVITFGINGQYTYEIFGPESRGRPIFYTGFVRPPDMTTVSILEDPYYYYALPAARACCLKPWSPLESAAAFEHQFAMIKSNARVILRVLIEFSPLAPAVVAAALAFCLAPLLPAQQRQRGSPACKRQRSAAQGVRDAFGRVLGSTTHLRIGLALVTLAIFTSLYALVSVEERYLWPMLILIAALGMHLLALWFRSGHLSKPVCQATLASIFVLTFLPLPLHKLKPNSALREATILFGRQLESLNLAGKSFASNADYGASVCVGYHIKAKYYGQPPPGMSDQAIAQDLQGKRVDYYFVFDTSPAPRPGMDLVRVFTARDRTLAVYAVRPADRLG